MPRRGDDAPPQCRCGLACGARRLPLSCSTTASSSERHLELVDKWKGDFIKFRRTQEYWRLLGGSPRVLFGQDYDQNPAVSRAALNHQLLWIGSYMVDEHIG
jgi:hypothetical protein